MKIFWKYEQLWKKLSVFKLDLFFFNRYRDLDLIPGFVRFKLPHLKVYKKPSRIHQSAIILHISMIQHKSSPQILSITLQRTLNQLLIPSPI